MASRWSAAGARVILAISLVVVLLAVTAQPAYTQPAASQVFAEWAMITVNPADAPSQGQAVVDDAGNVFLVGTFRGQATFGVHTLTSTADSADLYLAKFDTAGDALWAASFGGADPDEGRSVAIDAAGNVYVTGRTLHVPTTFVKSDMFVAKYDTNGAMLWTSSINASGHNEGNVIAADAAGNSYVAGSFNGTFIAGGTSYTAASKRMLVAKFDPQGNLVWARPANNSGFSDSIADLAVDAQGNVFATGSFDGTISFGDPVVSLTSSTNNDVFLMKYDAAGVLQWATAAGGSDGRDYGRAVAVDRDGNPHVAGTFQGMASFGPHAVVANGGSDAFVAKYSAAGTPLWATGDGGATNDFVESIAVDAGGSAYVTGTFEGSAVFGIDAVTANGVNDREIFVAGYDSMGSSEFTESVGGPNNDAVYSIAVDSAGSAYLAGYFAEDVTIDGQLLTATDYWGVFIAKFSPTSATCRGLTPTIDMRMGASGLGTAGDDVILGTAGADLIDGRGGDDLICGAAGDDQVQAGPGNDFVFGGAGHDVLAGGSGNDRLRGQQGNDSLSGNNGNDFLYGGTGDDMIFGGGGDDTIGGFGGADLIAGGAGNDVVFGGFGPDQILGDAGDDELHGLEGDDTLEGGDDADTIYGDKGQDQLFGDSGNDTLFGGNSTDSLDGGPGNDELHGGKANDGLTGGTGDDVCVGNLGTDTASGCETVFGVP